MLGAHFFTPLAATLFLLLLRASATLQNTVAQNYSSDILRLAKAAQIRAYLDTERDYCENFYKYACGKWKRLQPATLNKPKTSYMEQLQDLYVRRSAVQLQEKHSQDNNVDNLLKTYYAACRNESAVQQLGIEPILKAIDFKGGWPHVYSQTWYEYEYDWLKVVAEMRRQLGVDILIGLEVVPDYEDQDMNRLKVGAPPLALGSRDVYLDDDYDDERDDYKEAIAQKLHKHFPDMGRRWAWEVAQQVLSMEQQLAKGLPENAKLTLPQMTRQRFVVDLKTAYGNFVDLNRYFNIVLNQTIYSQVYETPEDYFSNLVDVIKNTPKLTIANYTMWRVLEHLDFAGKINEHNNDLWCVQQVKEHFPAQLENMFQRDYEKIHVVNEIQSTWADIKRVFHEELQSLPKLDWITLKTRQKAVQKLESIKLKLIGHDEQELAEEVRGLWITEGHYFSNLMNVLEWQTQRKLAKLFEKPQIESVAVQLPQYSHITNIIEIPVTFLQARFFWDAEYPHALKYATLGFVLAQEMLHAFDVTGRRYDAHGYQSSWWDAISEDAYDERAKCFAKHRYNNYVYRDRDFFSVEAQAESIADSGGLAIAYSAYQKWWDNLSDKHELLSKETLPLLDYTPQQLFFISYAQLWCVDYHESVKQFEGLPEPLRVNGVLANFGEFARQMKCKLGSDMHPAMKCVIY